jgi:hypothetical protein
MTKAGRGIMRKAFILLVILLAPSLAYSFQDKIAIWSKLEYSFETGEKMIITQDHLKLKSLSLILNGKHIQVPAEELSDITLPHIHTIYLSYSEFHAPGLTGVPYHVIHFRYGASKDEESFGEFPEAMFTFYKGSYQERTIRVKTSPTSWKLIEKKAGQQSQISGSESRIK